MTLRVQPAQPGRSRNAESSSSIGLEQLPSYRTAGSGSSQTPPQYESLEWADDLAALEAAQIEQKTPAGRARYEEPVPNPPAAAVTTSSTATPTPTPAATPAPLPAATRDVERAGNQESLIFRRHALMTFICGILFILLAMGHLIVTEALQPRGYPEEWSQFELNFYSVKKTFTLAQYLALLILVIAPIFISSWAILRRGRTWPAVVSAYLSVLCLLYTVLLVVYHLTFSYGNWFLRDKTYEEAVALMYQLYDTFN